MTTESKKPSEILRPLYEAFYAEWEERGLGLMWNSAQAIDEWRLSNADETHARLTALEAAMATITPPKPAAEDEVVFKGIGDIVYAVAGAASPQPSRSVEDEAREFYCKRHAGARLVDVSDWLVNDLTAFANQRTAAVERERDEWKAKFEKLEARWNTDHAAVYDELSTARSERDAALAKVAELESVGSFQHAVQRELEHAYAKHGRDPWSRHEFWGVLEEEVDELKEAIRRDMPTAEVIKELRQIACVCQRYAETGDRYRGNHPDVPIRPSTKGAANAPT